MGKNHLWWLALACVLGATGCGKPLPAGGSLERAMDGKSTYDKDCASCHRLATYDTTGSAPDLEGKGTRVSAVFSGGKSHNGVTLSEQQIVNISVWLDANFRGKDVYDVECSGCHRLGSYDITGDAPDIAGRQILNAHNLDAVSPADRINLNDWVNTP